MDGEKRRESILKLLEAADKPISASRFAKKFNVSRQIVVGDVALLRAAGHDVTATARGYLFAPEKNQSGIIRKIACQHTPEQTNEELSIIISFGAEVLDVIVEHPIYGELTGGLYIQTKQEIKKFVAAYLESQAVLLSELTDGVHLHTIRCADEETLANINAALAKAGILYESSE